MSMKKYQIVFFSLFIFNILFLDFAFSACVTSPSFVHVYSGSSDLGEKSISSPIYINPDLKNSPLSLEFVFRNNQANCFNNSEDFKLTLFSGSSEVSAQNFNSNFNNIYYDDTFIFDFSPDVTVSAAFTSTFRFKSSASSWSTGSLNFNIDNQGPSFSSIVPNTQTPKVVKGGENLDVSYIISDSKSGISQVSFNGNTINFNEPRSTYSNTTEFIVPNGNEVFRNYSIVAEDFLGNSNSENIQLFIDNLAPRVVSNSFQKFYEFQNGIRKVSFRFKIEDESFRYLQSSSLSVYGNFTSITKNSANQRVPASCNRDTTGLNNVYVCQFAPISIAINNTQSLSFNFNISDSLGNNRIYSPTGSDSEIFADSSAPEILDFYLYNEILGEKTTVISGYGTNYSIHLKFRDASLGDYTNNNYRIIEDFDQIQLMEEVCEINYVSKIADCVWDLANTNAAYEIYSDQDLEFKATVIDFYGNSANSKIGLKLDNSPPTIDEIEIVERADIKDKILKSGEKIDLRIYVSDNNLDIDGEYFVQAYLGMINLIDDEYVNAECHNFNITSIVCDFSDITLRNGYVNESVIFRVYDAGGNRYSEEKYLEIFKIANESIEIFVKDKTINIMNPINRDIIITSTAKTWFEGNLELATGINPDTYKIINYNVVNCNESGLNPLLFLDPPTLFPEDVILCEDLDEDKDCSEFFIQAKLRDHAVYDDLNDKTIDCTISVLKRDDEKVYPPELVNVKLKFGFYAIPRAHLINAYAADIMSDIERVDWLGDWIDDIYGYYEMFYGVCNIMGKVNSLVSNVFNIWTYISIVLNEITYTKAFAKGMDNVMSPLDGSISTFKQFSKPVTKMCNWVTCEVGTWASGPNTIVGTIQKWQEQIASTMCTKPAG